MLGLESLYSFFDKAHDGSSRCVKDSLTEYEREIERLKQEEASLQLYRNMPWSVTLSYDLHNNSYDSFQVIFLLGRGGYLVLLCL